MTNKSPEPLDIPAILKRNGDNVSPAIATEAPKADAPKVPKAKGGQPSEKNRVSKKPNTPDVKKARVAEIKLSEIAKEAKVDAKTARRRLRLAKVRKPAAGWVFPAAKRSEIIKIIKG